jgi:hypothetical protein
MATAVQLPWQLASGKPKPEWRLILTTVLSDGTKELLLHAPTIKAIRAAKKQIEYIGEGDTRDATEDSQLQFSITLVALTANVAEDIIEELPFPDFQQAMGYVTSFLEMAQSVTISTP